MPARFSASIILADALCVQGATSCNETTNERLGVSAANIGRKSAATASVMASNFPLRGQPNKAKMARSTMALLCRKIVSMPLITLENSEGLRKIDAGETAGWERAGSQRQFFGSPGAPRLAKRFDICSSILKRITP